MFTSAGLEKEPEIGPKLFFIKLISLKKKPCPKRCGTFRHRFGHFPRISFAKQGVLASGMFF